ncbi:MAG: nucleotide pyrophosphohydrolase [Deltaproteobacteria bacterium]|nr:nucleotide pyrophosphohydrolase [Deltaproteobacteria bacterium]
MRLTEATESARQVRDLLARLETRRHGRPWNLAEIALGFVGDVGDLAKLVQGAGGVRDIPDLSSRLSHELADCLWCVLVLADQLDVDIETAFTDTMRQLTEHARSELGES